MKIDIRKHPVKKWEVSIAEFVDSDGKKYKVTKRLPGLMVAETKIFSKKEEAIALFYEWLN